MFNCIQYFFYNNKTTFIMRKLNFNFCITFIGGFVAFFISVLLSVLFCIYSHHGGDNINGRLIMEIWPLVICMTTVIWGINCFLIFKNKHSACPLTRVKRIAFIIMSIVVLLPSFVFNDCFLSTVSFRSISSFNDWYGVFIEKWICVCWSIICLPYAHGSSCFSVQFKDRDSISAKTNNTCYNIYRAFLFFTCRFYILCRYYFSDNV